MMMYIYICMLKELLKGFSYGNFYQLELSGIWAMLLELAGGLQVNRNNAYWTISNEISIMLRRELILWSVANTWGV